MVWKILIILQWNDYHWRPWQRCRLHSRVHWPSPKTRMDHARVIECWLHRDKVNWKACTFVWQKWTWDLLQRTCLHIWGICLYTRLGIEARIKNSDKSWVHPLNRVGYLYWLVWKYVYSYITVLVRPYIKSSSPLGECRLWQILTRTTFWWHIVGTDHLSNVIIVGPLGWFLIRDGIHIFHCLPLQSLCLFAQSISRFWSSLGFHWIYHACNPRDNPRDWGGQIIHHGIC